MQRPLRVKCPCGNVANVFPGQICAKCKRPVPISNQGLIQLYRKGSPLGVAGGFGIYLNDVPYGYIGNKETVMMPLPFGSYKLHIAVGMSRRCTDMMITLTPENPVAYMKVWMKPGFWSNSFVLEPSTVSEMP